MRLKTRIFVAKTIAKKSYTDAIDAMKTLKGKIKKPKGFTLKKVGELRKKIGNKKVFDPISSKVSSAMKDLKKSQTKKNIIYGGSAIAGGVGAYAIAKNNENKKKG